MRSNRNISNRKMLAAAVLIAAATSLAFGDTPVWSIRVVETVVQENVVVVRVANLGTTSAAGTIAVQALTTGGVASQSALVSLAPGQSALVSVGFANNVLSVVSVGVTPLGVIDDLNPF